MGNKPLDIEVKNTVDIEENIPLVGKVKKPAEIDSNKTIVIKVKKRVDNKGNTPVGIEGDTPVDIGGNTPVDIGGNTPFDIGGNTPVDIEGNTPVDIGGNTPVDIGGNTPLDIGGNTPVDIEGNTHVDIEGNTHVDIEGMTPADIEGNTHVDIEGNKPKNIERNKPVDIKVKKPLQTLPLGWTRKATRRLGGKLAGKWDIYYFSPAGKKIRSRVELMRELSDVYDLSSFDYNTGKAYTADYTKPTRGRGRKRVRAESYGSKGSDLTSLAASIIVQNGCNQPVNLYSARQVNDKVLNMKTEKEMSLKYSRVMRPYIEDEPETVEITKVLLQPYKPKVGVSIF